MKQGSTRHFAEDIRGAFNSEFFNREMQQYATGSQASNAIALRLNSCPGKGYRGLLAPSGKYREG